MGDASAQVASEHPPVLAYARASPRSWGPLIFRPSVLSLVLLAATLAAGWYVHRHPRAWEKTVILNASPATAPATTRQQFNSDATLLVTWTTSQEWPVQVWDTHSGALLHVFGQPSPATLPSPSRPRVYFIRDGDQMLVFHPSDRVELWDTRLGLRASMPWPFDWRPWEIVGERIVSHGTDAGDEYYELPETLSGQPRRIGTVPNIYGGHDADHAGRFLIYREGHDYLGEARHVVFDARTLRQIGELPAGSYRFVYPDIRSGDGRQGPAAIEHRARSGLDFILRSLPDGHVLLTIQTSGQFNGMNPYLGDVSRDGRWLQLAHSSGLLALRDLETGVTLPVVSPPREAIFFPDGHRLLVRERSRLLLRSPEQPRPLAVLDLPPGYFLRLVNSRGQRIATGLPQGPFALWARTGRESTFGILGLRQTWLLLATAILLSASLWRDARRRADPDHRSLATTLLSLALVLLGTAGTLAMTLDWCLDSWHPNPGPALLLAGLGLATTGRLWSMLTLFLTAALAILPARFALTHWPPQLAGWTLHPIFDRDYWLPAYLPPALAATCAVALILTILASTRALLRR